MITIDEAINELTTALMQTESDMYKLKACMFQVEPIPNEHPLH